MSEKYEIGDIVRVWGLSDVVIFKPYKLVKIVKVRGLSLLVESIGSRKAYRSEFSSYASQDWEEYAKVIEKKGTQFNVSKKNIIPKSMLDIMREKIDKV